MRGAIAHFEALAIPSYVKVTTVPAVQLLARSKMCVLTPPIC